VIEEKGGFSAERLQALRYAAGAGVELPKWRALNFLRRAGLIAYSGDPMNGRRMIHSRLLDSSSGWRVVFLTDIGVEFLAAWEQAHG
jgi:hypothetical protein